jgi:Phytochelatin synthase
MRTAVPVQPVSLAAYDADTDRFLILDVSRYKSPPVWVETSAIFAAMNTTDSDAADKTRGYVIVGR